MTQTVVGPGEFQEDEYEATAAVTPGDLVEPTGTEVAPHGSADGRAEPVFAISAQHLGKTIDDDYATGETVHCAFTANGTKVPGAWLNAGENVTAGTRLVSAGNGALAAYDNTNFPDADVVAVAEEAVDNSGGASPVRIEVRSA